MAGVTAKTSCESTNMAVSTEEMWSHAISCWLIFYLHKYKLVFHYFQSEITTTAYFYHNYYKILLMSIWKIVIVISYIYIFVCICCYPLHNNYYDILQLLVWLKLLQFLVLLLLSVLQQLLLLLLLIQLLLILLLALQQELLLLLASVICTGTFSTIFFTHFQCHPLLCFLLYFVNVILTCYSYIYLLFWFLLWSFSFLSYFVCRVFSFSCTLLCSFPTP